MTLEMVAVDEPIGLNDYAEVIPLAGAVEELRELAAEVVPRLAGRRVWMVNSTAEGGGVAEMLPKMLTLLRELGVDARWVVISTERTEFFALTKRIHNLIHGAGEPRLTETDRELYEAVSRENAALLAGELNTDDLLVVHDPQPLGSGAILKQQLGLESIWRCHIGLDRVVPATQAVWGFLAPYASAYDHAVFSAPEYVPDYLSDRYSLIRPAIDPLGPKNRELSVKEVAAILRRARLVKTDAVAGGLPFLNHAQRLRPDGRWAPADEDDIGLLFRPIVTQVSRWDRLKGFAPLLDAFVRVKARCTESGITDEHRRRLEAVRLLLVGPDPRSVADDPEGLEVMEELSSAYRRLDPDLQRDVALITLPMESREENALMVNAIQRCSTVVVQNSIQEGFGLTATEAMWKGVPVVASSACGLRQQILDGYEGRLVSDPEDTEELANVLDKLLADPTQRRTLGQAAQRRVYREFLVLSQLRDWLRTLMGRLDA
jgi:trehalose synthase